MTSSKPVTNVNAINFTPDNKGCYAYSGAVGVAGDEKDLCNFDTNSEYLEAKILFRYAGTGSEGDNYSYRVRFNDILIIAYLTDHSLVQYQNNVLIPVIVPPFTNVRLTAENITDTSTHDQAVIFVGRAVGLTETGYQ